MAQKNFTLTINLLSDTLIGNAEGYGAIIDKDSVFDEVGLPFIPGKRVKGILREQAELYVRYGEINIDNFIEDVFGMAGQTDKKNERLSVSNFMLDDYQNNKSWIQGLIKTNALSKSEVQEYFTSMRMMTRIDSDGIASDTSLRTFRVLKKGLVFIGEVGFDSNLLPHFEKIVSLTRRIGSSRNRGMGHIKCTLQEKTKGNS